MNQDISKFGHASPNDFHLILRNAHLRARRHQVWWRSEREPLAPNGLHERNPAPLWSTWKKTRSLSSSSVVQAKMGVQVWTSLCCCDGSNQGRSTPHLATSPPMLAVALCMSFREGRGLRWLVHRMMRVLCMWCSCTRACLVANQHVWEDRSWLSQPLCCWLLQPPLPVWQTWLFQPLLPFWWIWLFQPPLPLWQTWLFQPLLPCW